MTRERRPVAGPTYPCAVCNRGSAGFAFSAPGAHAAPAFFCSMHCSEVWMIAHRKKIELTRDEATAALTGGTWVCGALKANPALARLQTTHG